MENIRNEKIVVLYGKRTAALVLGLGYPSRYETSMLQYFPEIGSQMAVMSSALYTGLPLFPPKFLVIITVRS
jgi:hypothetical protein